MSWFAVMTHARRERDACREIEALDLRTFYPWERVRRNRRKGHGVVTEWIEVPYYARYAFADCSTSDVHRINAIRYVSSVVSFGGIPRSIPDPVMAVVMAGANASGQMGARDEVARKRFEVASSVTFADGPFAGVIARILQDDGQRDVTVLLNIMGAQREMKVSASSVEAVAA